MGQVAFDTQEFVETLENAGLPKEQAKAISIAVRKSHEVADVATKRDLDDVRKEIDGRFDKLDVKIDSQISLVRKDVEGLTNSLLIKLSGVMLAIVGAAATIVTLIIKLV
ncbi:MAG: DUF1640 domain-containing protein [Candidatus Phlomobacter fragariae]